LKIRALEILGVIDLNQNTQAALNDWTELLTTAKSAGDAKWVNRANGNLGIVAGMNGDIGSAAKGLFQGLGTAEKLGDIPGELTFGTWLANGMSNNGISLRLTIERLGLCQTEGFRQVVCLVEHFAWSLGHCADCAQHRGCSQCRCDFAQLR
jgi:hypothetical protein